MEVARLAKGGMFGWGLLLAWLFCTYYTGIATQSTDWASCIGGAPADVSAASHVVPLLAAILSIVALLALEKRHGEAIHGGALLWVGALLCSAGTPLAFSAAIDPAVSLAGVVMTGIGSSILWMLWGSYYTRIPSEETELYACVSAVCAALLVFAMTFLPGWLPLLVVSLLPLLSGLCLHLANAELSKRGGSVFVRMGELRSDQLEESRLVSAASMWKSGVVLGVMYAFISVLGQMGELPDSFSIGFRIATLVYALLLVFLGIVSVSGPRRISVPFLLRWMTPLLVAGFAALIVFPYPAGSTIASNVASMGRLGFCLVTQIYFSRFVGKGFATAMQSYGMGWLCVHIGDFVGVGMGVLVSCFLQDGFDVTQLAGVAIVLVSFTALIPFGADGVFSDWNSVTGKQQEGEDVAEAPVMIKVAGSEAQPAEPDDGVREDAKSYDDLIAELAGENGLTKRETEVFSLLMYGRSVPYIRDKLVVSRDTAATHVKHIYAKMGVHSRQELLDLIPVE